MGLGVNQASRARDGDVIRCLLIVSDRKELPQCERIGNAPGDAALAVESPSKKPIIMLRVNTGPGAATDAPVSDDKNRHTALFAETVELGLVQDFVKAFVEGVTRCGGQIAAVPQLFLSLPHLPRAHRHTQILKSKHFQVQLFSEFRHGLLKDRAPQRLSGGEKKRVALASVLVLDPAVLLLDEPTAGLDPKSRSQLIDLLVLVQWGGGAKSVIIATHDLDDLRDTADRCYVLDSGSLAAEGSPDDILCDRDLLERTNLIHANVTPRSAIEAPRFHSNGAEFSHP